MVKIDFFLTGTCSFSRFSLRKFLEHRAAKWRLDYTWLTDQKTLTGNCFSTMRQPLVSILYCHTSFCYMKCIRKSQFLEHQLVALLFSGSVRPNFLDPKQWKPPSCSEFGWRITIIRGTRLEVYWALWAVPTWNAPDFYAVECIARTKILGLWLFIGVHLFDAFVHLTVWKRNLAFVCVDFLSCRFFIVCPFTTRSCN